MIKIYKYIAYNMYNYSWCHFVGIRSRIRAFEAEEKPRTRWAKCYDFVTQYIENIVPSLLLTGQK